MMRRKTAIILVVPLVIFLAWSSIVTSQPNRIIVNGADWIEISDVNFSGTLADLASNVKPRITLNYAQTVNKIASVYPVDLMNDTQPPQFSQSNVGNLANGNIIIAWITDEYAIGSIRYGEAPDNYTNVVSETLFSKRHEVLLPNLTPYTTYFFQISNTDLSNNVNTSVESSFVAANFLYLPIVLR